MEDNKDQDKKNSNEERPPIFRSWRRWYLLVISALLTYMLLLYLFSSLY